MYFLTTVSILYIAFLKKICLSNSNVISIFIYSFSIFRCNFYFRYMMHFLFLNTKIFFFYIFRHIDPFSISRHIDPFSIFRHIILPSGTLQLLDVRQEDSGDYRCSATGGELHKLPDQVDSLPWKRSNAATLRVITGGSRSKEWSRGQKDESCILIFCLLK